MRPIKHIIVHCADTPASMDIGAKEIDAWHRDRGWSAIGYHYVIRRSGDIEKGRDLDGDGNVDEEIGAHALGYNRYSLGICLVGGKGPDARADMNFTHNQMGTLYRLLVALTTEYPNAEVIGHRDVSDKACPSFDVKSWWAGHA
ncbi:N-acetylmuramoyl-L-alanine amidase [Maricaulis sp.]|uniref:N-acetylmuramoyl-L-alanine amidase n=1 Tax=Maricaulis sp. TaxID=1486257 RepID=UPI002627A4DC|nr:N-acetylmuramoyl-L-alanine amidase [Maricaulis sp.]MDF1769875.1 N-acetylmuramoyl-L-alanine amidase [Maricaulis sp.]